MKSIISKNAVHFPKIVESTNRGDDKVYDAIRMVSGFSCACLAWTILTDLLVDMVDSGTD